MNLGLCTVNLIFFSLSNNTIGSPNNKLSLSNGLYSVTSSRKNQKELFITLSHAKVEFHNLNCLVYSKGFYKVKSEGNFSCFRRLKKKLSLRL